MDILSQFQRIFETDLEVHTDAFRTHLDRIRETDQLTPPNSTFLTIANTTTQKYDYLSENFTILTGHDRADFMAQGMPFFLQQVHPDDVQIWLGGLADIISFVMQEVSPENRLRVDVRFNFRMRMASGEYVNIIENQVPIHLDQYGKPVVGMGYVMLNGQGDPQPIQGTVRLLNDAGQYETLLHKNYSQKLLTDGLTNRERDVIRQVALGDDNETIGQKLFISKETVKTHRKNILRKLQCDNFPEVIAKIMSRGFFL
ncbi:LuxR C-terminal-related transcriptional regulator [Pontibacter sp. G13]|uniref:LuxR C-terminal-related transcriptional regulator n=1 Tax=Pontibacter sp. G13 TaxID=3074898 RepID=UPI002889866F|nr:LuxR C-terminal-related transcriptional regulator [Pontibacter sp. G13]WNJ17346.1 LuxR C-terminal-related transcriptional regulator [Pontibacter sp. G13]